MDESLAIPAVHAAAYFYSDEAPYTIYPMKYAWAFVVLSVAAVT